MLKEDRKKIGIILIVVGIPLLLLLYSYFYFLIPLICIGLYFIIPPKEPGLKNEADRKKVIRGIGLGMLVVSLICLIGGIWFGSFSNWTGSLAAYGWLIPIIFGIILMVIGCVVVLFSLIKSSINS
ncbi:MAG: hypothetical protein ACW98X_11570 [Promethearchaeota archaeon]|jgi:hypothetical protein